MNDALLRLLDLEQRLLGAQRSVEVAFLAVNMAHALVPYRQAVLGRLRGELVALSGVTTVPEATPYGLWLGRLFRHLAATPAARPLTALDLPPALAEGWADWLPAQALFLPLGDEALLYARDEPFSPPEIALLTHLAAVVRAARRSVARPQRSISRARLLLGGVVGLGIALLPVTESVLAPADAVPAHPVVVRAPLEGVVDHVAVAPNESVQEGQVLFQLDATTLTGALDVARQQLGTAQAEHRQAAQAMVFDAKAKAQVPLLQGKAEEKAAEVRLLESQLARITARAPRAGVAVFDDPSEWVGKPVVVGEKVMAVADPEDTEVEAWVAVTDVGWVRPGARLTLFLNTSPLSPLRARVTSIAYEAVVRPDASVAHRVRARLEDAEIRPRLGLKGTARIEGETVPLVWWVLRKPITTLRQGLGV